MVCIKVQTILIELYDYLMSHRMCSLATGSSSLLRPFAFEITCTHSTLTSQRPSITHLSSRLHFTHAENANSTTDTRRTRRYRVGGLAKLCAAQHRTVAHCTALHRTALLHCTALHRTHSCRYACSHFASAIGQLESPILIMPVVGMPAGAAQHKRAHRMPAAPLNEQVAR